MKVVEKLKIRVLYLVTLFFFKIRAVYEIMWNNLVEPDWLQVTE